MAAENPINTKAAGTHSLIQVVIISSISGIVLGPADTVIEKRDEGVLREGRIQFK